MNEVSKIGQPEEEPIEGKIVPGYQGPGFNAWDYIDAAVRGSFRHKADDGEDALIAPGGWMTPKEQHYDIGNVYRANSMKVSGDGENWTDIGSGGVTYSYGVDPGGPDVTLGWLDELHNLHTQTITTSFTVDDMDPQAFKLLTGYDYDVLRVVQKSPWTEPATVPAVDPAKVRWPRG